MLHKEAEQLVLCTGQFQQDSIFVRLPLQQPDGDAARFQYGDVYKRQSCGGLMWEKWRKEYVKVMDCKTWDEMVAFMKSVSPKDGVGVMAYTCLLYTSRCV